MAEQKKYLDYEGLQRLVQNLNNKYAPIKALVFKLSVEDVAHLPALNTVRPGWMYNIEKEDITTADFIEGAGHVIQVGENIAAVELFTGEYTKVAAPVITDDPKALGWYELDAVTSTYELSQDRIPVQGKDYFTANTVMKWDMLGGIFDLEDKYLEFGIEFPKNPADGRTFLYMGENTKVYTIVETPTGRPSENKYYEGVFTEVDPAVKPINNPKQEGLYELNGSTYVLSEDIEYNDEKTYYTGVFTLSVDSVVDPTKHYYSEADQYNHAVIYVYSEAEEDWIPQTSSGSGDMVPITAQEIDDLFI